MVNSSALQERLSSPGRGVTKLEELIDFQTFTPLVGLAILQLNWMVGYQTLMDGNSVDRTRWGVVNVPDSGVYHLAQNTCPIFCDNIPCLGLRYETVRRTQPLCIGWL